MKVVSLLDVTKIKNNRVEKFDGFKKYVATGDVSDNKIVSYTNVTFKNRPSRADIQADINTVIFARMKDTNKVLRINECNKDYIYSTGFCVLEPGQNITPQYLEAFLRSPYFQRQKDKLSTGATQKAINNTEIKNIMIPLPPLQIQKKIVEVLDKAQELIDLRKKQIELLDKLIESTFYDMFGDPVVNPKGWEEKQIGDIFEVKTGSTPSRKTKEYWDIQEVPWVKTNEVNNGVITSTEEYISFKALKETSVSLFPINTILIAMYGQGKTRGKVAMLGIEATTNQACAALLPTNKVNVNYMFNYLKVSYEELRRLGRGGNQPNLNLSLVRNFKVPVPPIKIQNEFAQKVEKIEETRELMQESLDEMEKNYNSLMQRAFRGELFY